jgi:integrase
MATIQKLVNKSDTTYRVLIRKKGLKAISKTFPTKRQASQFALKVESDTKIQQSLGGISNITTFKKASNVYLSSRYPGATPPRSHEGRIEFWDNLFKDRRLIDITKSEIVDGLKQLPNKLSNSTVNKYKAAASVVFNYACREFDLPENPVKHIRSLPEPRGRTRYLSDDERGRLFGAVRQSSWNKLYLITLLAITTGARKGELTSLKWSDIDFDRQIAYISTTKNGEPKVLPLTESVIAELQRFNKQDNSLVFDSEVKPGRAYCFTKPWKKALKQAEIADFTFHSLRHTCASYLAMNGASLLEIADVLGHKQIQMTKRYSHLCTNHKAKLINSVMGNI